MTAVMQDTQDIVKSLTQQIIEKRQQQREQKPEPSKYPIDQQDSDADTEATPQYNEEKKNGFKFQKGDKNWDVDDDAEFEFMADKRPIKMTLKEMRDAAAGGIAVRNRMRQVADERKALSEPFKDFSRIAKDDPLGALQKMFGAIQTVDPDADFNEFISDLARQAQTVAHMEPNARKAYQLEKQLKEKDERLSEADQLQNLAELKQELMESGLPEAKIYEYGQQILNHPVLSQSVETEEDLMERIADLAEEVDAQKASFEALRKHQPAMSARDPLVFELSNLLRANPDFDQQDLDDIASEVMGSVQRAKAAQKLSKRQRTWTGTRDPQSTPDFSKMKPVDALRYQIEQKKKQQQAQKK